MAPETFRLDPIPNADLDTDADSDAGRSSCAGGEGPPFMTFGWKSSPARRHGDAKHALMGGREAGGVCHASSPKPGLSPPTRGSNAVDLRFPLPRSGGEEVHRAS